MPNPKSKSPRQKQIENRRRAAEKQSRLDIVIPVMGPTGAGKSTFINAVLGQGEHMAVGRKLSSCTSELALAIVDSRSIKLPISLQGRQVLMVDTPGFDDTYEGDAEILKRIAEWLDNSYRSRPVVLAGVIYLHDISHDRFSGTARRNLEMFNHLCGEAALDKVILGTTKWERLVGVNGKEREDELKAEYWKSMIESGTRVQRFENSRHSALEFINDVLRRYAKDEVVEATPIERPLQIQKELGLDLKIVPETEAGKDLRYTLTEVLKMQKQMAHLEAEIAKGGDRDAAAKLEETRKKMHSLKEGLKELKIPFTRQFCRFLGIKY